MESITLTTQTDDLSQEIEKVIQHFGQIGEFSAKQFAQQVLRLKKMSTLFDTPESLFYEDKLKDERLRTYLNNATKALSYDKRPYQIAFVGSMGAGKSKLINTLLGSRPLLKTTAGASVTGTVVRIFFQSDPQAPEQVVIVPRKESDILEWIKRFAKEQGLKNEIPPTLTQALLNELPKWQPPTELEEKGQDYFNKLRNALAETVKHYMEQASEDKLLKFLFSGKEPLRKSFATGDNGEFTSPLTAEVEDYLRELMDENSTINKQENRVRLVSSISYYLKPLEANSPSSLQLTLPPSLCLVDLPGSNPNNPLHDLLFIEGVREANVVVILLAASERIPEKDAFLYTLVKKYVSDPDRRFLGVNRWDQATPVPDEMRTLERALEDAKESLEKRDYYRLSALVAYDAQLGLQGKKRQIEVHDQYEKAAKSLGVNNPDDYQAALQASNIPRLLEDLRSFIGDRFIRSQMESGRQAMDDICQRLQNVYPSLPVDNPKIIREVEDKLEERLKTIGDVIFEFHQHQHQNVSRLRGQLATEIETICDEIAADLQEHSPVFWKHSYEMKRDRSFGGGVQGVKSEGLRLQFLDKVQFAFWAKLPEGMKRLASTLVSDYEQAINNPRYNFKGKISEAIHSLVASAESEVSGIDSRVEEAVKEIREKLLGFSDYVALSQVTDETILLTQNEEPQPGLVDSLRELEQLRRKDLPTSQFKKFVEAVRPFYRRALKPDSLEALLRLYEYQMACSHKDLWEYLQDWFTTLKTRVHNDRTLCIEILETSREPNLEKRERLNQKRQAIFQLGQNNN